MITYSKTKKKYRFQIALEIVYTVDTARYLRNRLGICADTLQENISPTTHRLSQSMRLRDPEEITMASKNQRVNVVKNASGLTCIFKYPVTGRELTVSIFPISHKIILLIFLSLPE